MILDRFEKRLQELAPGDSVLAQAMRYALFGKGKRIRPKFLFAAMEAFDADAALGIDAACAIEMVHTYSLIHDDLPCMDDDDERRGRPTLHRVYPESIALLAGDTLLTEAFGVLARAAVQPLAKVRMIELLSERSGLHGMAGGQGIDVLSDSSMQEDLLLEMHQKKTADLLSCALEFGALLAGRSTRSMRTIGLQLGLAYQIRDDLEDEEQDQSKPNSLTVLGKQRAARMLEQCIATIDQAIQTLPSPEPLQQLLKALFQSVLIHSSCKKF